MAITASMVAELRAKTDAPMMECKKALTEARAAITLTAEDSSEADKIAARDSSLGTFTML